MEEFHDEEEISGQDLYESFKAHLSGKSDEAFFDEDDLISIFDVAGDFDDDYIRLEVLFYGARYFPSSTALADRRGIFYQTYSDSMRDSYLNDHPELLTFVSSVLRLRAVAPEPELARKMLDDLIDGADNLSDEEMIQLADAAAALGVSGWLLDRLDVLRAKTEYPATLLYEMDVIFEMEKKPEICEKVLEDLTELEPFNSEFWRLLAQVQSELGKHELAESSIEYALAIEPTAKENLMVKAGILLATENPDKVDEATEILEKVLEMDSSDLDAAKQLMICYLTLDNRERARALADRLFPRYKGCDWLIAGMIALYPEKFDSLIKAFDEAGPHSEEDWIRVADMTAGEHPFLGAMVMLHAVTKIKFHTSWEALLRHLYSSEHYTEVCNFVASLADDEEFRQAFTGEMSVLYVKSLLKIGKYDDAKEYARTWVETFNGDGVTEEELKFEAISSFMREVLSNLSDK